MRLCKYLRNSLQQDADFGEGKGKLLLACGLHDGSGEDVWRELVQRGREAEQFARIDITRTSPDDFRTKTSGVATAVAMLSHLPTWRAAGGLERGRAACPTERMGSVLCRSHLLAYPAVIWKPVTLPSSMVIKQPRRTPSPYSAPA